MDIWAPFRGESTITSAKKNFSCSVGMLVSCNALAPIDENNKEQEDQEYARNKEIDWKD